MRTQADGRRPGSQRARRGRETGALGLNQGAQLAASVPGSPGLSRWFGTNMVFGHQAQQYRSVYVGWGRSLGPRGHCRHSTLWQWGERREDTRAPRGSVLSYDRHRPNHNIQGKGTQFTTLVGRSEVATWQFLWKRSSTGKTTVSRSELAEERSSEVDLQKMIFLHREDQSIQFSRKFY